MARETDAAPNGPSGRGDHGVPSDSLLVRQSSGGLAAPQNHPAHPSRPRRTLGENVTQTSCFPYLSSRASRRFTPYPRLSRLSPLPVLHPCFCHILVKIYLIVSNMSRGMSKTRYTSDSPLRNREDLGGGGRVFLCDRRSAAG